MSEFDISVLVTTYNHEDFIETALDSITRQVVGRTIEIVIADDCSTDATAQRAAEWIVAHPEANARIVPRDANLGATRNYQQGFKECGGEYIAVLEGDDEWLACDKLQLQADALDERSDLTAVVGRVLRFDEATFRGDVLPPIGFDSFLTELTDKDIALYNWPATFSAYMYRAQALSKVPAAVYDVESYDWAIAMSITEHGPIGLLPQCMTLYRHHSDNVWASTTIHDQLALLETLVPQYVQLFGTRVERELQHHLARVRAESAEAAAAASASKASAPSPLSQRSIPHVSATKPRVSVLLTSYNNNKYLAESVTSVLTQTMGDLELIIVDDASADASWSTIAALEDERIRSYRLATNQGGAAALNYCVQEARADLVAVINSDDVWEPTKLEVQLAILDHKPEVGAAFSDVKFIDDVGGDLPADHFMEQHAPFAQPNRTPTEWTRHFFTHGNALCHPSAVVRRSLYIEHGLYDNRMRQLPDLERWAVFALHSEFYVSPDKLVHFRIQPGTGNTSSLSEESIQRTRLEHQWLARSILDKCPPEHLRGAFAGSFRNEAWETEIERECEAAFLCFDAEGPLRPVNRGLGADLFFELLASPRHRLFLAGHYGVTDLHLHRATGDIGAEAFEPRGFFAPRSSAAALFAYSDQSIPTRMLASLVILRIRTLARRVFARILGR